MITALRGKRGRTHPSLQLIRSLTRKPTPMFLIGSPGREDGNLSPGAAKLPSVVRADSCPPRLQCPLTLLRSPLALDASQVSLLYKSNIQEVVNCVLHREAVLP